MKLPSIQIDIHSHSTFSDGVDSPEKLLQMAARANLSVYSITDHDSLLSFLHLVNEAPDALDHIPFVFIPGTEITTDSRFGRFDLLYYLPRCAVGDFAALEKLGITVPEHLRGRRVTVADIPKDALDMVRELEAKLRGCREERLTRMQTMFAQLKEYYPEMRCFDWDEFCADNGMNMEAHTSPGTVGRPHLADYMIKKHIVSDRTAAFKHYLAEDKPCIILSKGIDLEEQVSAAAGMHAFPIVAHAFLKSDSQIASAAGILASAGLRGLEVYHNKHGDEHRRILVDLCERFGLVQSIGSDFHSESAGHVLGVPRFNLLMPEEVKRKLVEALLSV